ncbi:MAG: 2Fe-2S iron-sulfur cluster-binding protein [Deltaproteobacteria bacterium]|nr:2Fe-2S iron-sulfur cluster-binding protein [Deltaproteobacteria bacterium]
MGIVRFEPLGLSVDAAPGESVFSIGRRAGVPISTHCTGNGNCGLCRVTVQDGAGELSAPSRIETLRLSKSELGSGVRLSCQAKVGDGLVTVCVPPLVRV